MVLSIILSSLSITIILDWNNGWLPKLHLCCRIDMLRNYGGIKYISRPLHFIINLEVLPCILYIYFDSFQYACFAGGMAALYTSPLIQDLV